MLFFPDFVPQFTQPDFTSRMNVFLDSSLPVHIEAAVSIITSDQLTELILKFCNWRNSLRGVEISDTEQEAYEDEQRKSAMELISLIIELHGEGND